MPTLKIFIAYLQRPVMIFHSIEEFFVLCHNYTHVCFVLMGGGEKLYFTEENNAYYIEITANFFKLIMLLYQIMRIYASLNTNVKNALPVI